jgi:hypothetical protein
MARLSHYRSPPSAQTEQRAEPRLTLSIARASVRRQGKTPIMAALHDLSSYGCRLLSTVTVDEGERLWLRFNGQMPMSATVIWCLDGMVGCRFDEQMDRQLMRSLTLSIA